MLDTVREFAAEHAANGDDLAALELPARALLHGATANTPRTRRRARIGATGSTGSRRSAATSASPSSGCCSAGASDEALRVAIAFARALPWDAHAHEVRGWLAQALDAPAPPAPERPRRRPVLGRRLALSAGTLRRRPKAQLEAALAVAREAGVPSVEAAVAGRSWPPFGARRRAGRGGALRGGRRPWRAASATHSSSRTRC